MYYGGFPATISSGYSKVVPSFGKAIAPYGKIGGFGKPFAKGFAKPFGKGFAKPFGKGFGAYGFPATKSGGFSSVVPATTVATGPSVI